MTHHRLMIRIKTVLSSLLILGLFANFAATFDASTVQAAIPQGTPTTLVSSNSRFWAIALDNTHVYWTDVGNGLILKVPKIGGDVATLASTTPNVSLAIAVFGNFVYFAETNAVTGVGRIKMVPVDGGTVTTIASSDSWGGYNGIRGLAVDSSGVYWTVSGNNAGTNGMVIKLSGPVDNPVLLSLTAPTVLAAGLQNPMGLAIDGVNVYWIETGGGKVGKIGKNGGVAVPIASGLGELSGIATDGVNVFFGIWNGTVHKVSVMGGLVSNLGGFTSSQYLAIDSTSVYFTSIWGDAVGKVEKDGTGQTILASGLVNPWGLAVDETGLYWTECPTCYPGMGAVKKLPASGDTTPPTVDAFSVTPDSVTLGNPFTISYTVSDAGGSGLKQVELWRAIDDGGAPDPAWPGNPITTTAISGNSYSGSFSDAPPAAGTYWYGIHVVDNASNWAAEGSPSMVEVISTEIVFQPPYRLSDKSGRSETFLLGKATYYSEVDPSVGYAKMNAVSEVSFAGYGEALAVADLGDYWTNGWSGTATIAATFDITGIIQWVRMSFPRYITKVYLGVNFEASLWVYDQSSSTEIWRKDLTIYNKGPEWKLISPPGESDRARYIDTHYIIQGSVDLEKDHEYSWHFKLKLSSRVDVSGFATAVAGGNFVAYNGDIELIDVRIIAPPVVIPEPEPVVTSENVMYVAVASPVDILIVDPEGRAVGFDFASQQEINEIPEASYSGCGTHPQLIMIPTPVAGNYKFLVFGTGTGLYNAVIFTHDTVPETVSFMACDIPIAPAAVHQYIIDWYALSQGEEGVTVNVDSNGDGEFERTVIADNELTQEEFLAGTTPTPTPGPTPGGSCFIATAAYGSYLDSHVQTLRTFRDSYMLTNPVGKSLVSVYYKLSPPVAEFIDEHPTLKPIVRVGLLPAVALSEVGVNTTSAQKTAIMGSLALVSVALAVWLSRRRGKRSQYS